LIVVNKVDLLSRPPMVNDPDVLAVSALTKAGLPELLARIATRLAPEPPPGAAVPFTARQVDCLTAAHRYLADGDGAAAQLALERLISGRTGAVKGRPTVE
jgi:tRNA U34 5-carboxymethylaminomethyl modifying GTPase MnmE/TrmE